MIYGRTGDECKIVRVATLADVRELDGRKPDEHDRDALKNSSYVVVVFPRHKDGVERLYHLAFLRADGGSREITEAIERLGAGCAP